MTMSRDSLKKYKKTSGKLDFDGMARDLAKYSCEAVREVEIKNALRAVYLYGTRRKASYAADPSDPTQNE